MIILQYHEIFFRLTAPRCPSMAAGAVSLRKSHYIVILSFCNIIKGQALLPCFKLSVRKERRGKPIVDNTTLSTGRLSNG